MRPRFLLSIAGAGFIGAFIACSWSVDAVAATPLPDTCYDVGYACFNAGPGSDEAGTCVASTCVDLLDASFACGVCELADAGGAGAHDAGSADAHVSDASPWEDDTGAGGSTFDAAPSGQDAADDAPLADDGSSSGNGTSADGATGSSSSDGSAGMSSSDDEPDAGAAAAGPMPGCAATPLRPSGRTGLGMMLALTAGAAVRRRRSRSSRGRAPGVCDLG